MTTLASGGGPVLSTIQGDELDVWPGDVRIAKPHCRSALNYQEN